MYLPEKLFKLIIINYLKNNMKGISPMLATVLLIAFTIAVGGIISVFFTNLTRTQTGETEAGSTAVVECSNVRVDILAVSGAGTNGTMVLTNPSKNKIYITGVVDNTANSTNLALVVPATSITLEAGNTETMYNVGITGTATKITVVGLCENSVQTSNFSVTGVCMKGATCWPS